MKAFIVGHKNPGHKNLSMLVSFERKFAFIHIQKTGGQSIHQALAGVAPDAVDRFEGMPAFRLKGRHLFASDLRDHLGDQTWNSLFTFAFVRNPWARLVSWYNYINNMLIKGRSGPVIRLLQEKARTFDDFLFLTEDLALRPCNDNPPPQDRSAGMLPEASSPASDVAKEKLHMLEKLVARTTFNQVDYISDKDGRVLVDFVGRYENLAADFTRICERLEISPVLPHINETSRVDYRTYYTLRTRDLVAERFSRDIKAFGYQFDGPVLDNAFSVRVILTQN